MQEYFLGELGHMQQRIILRFHTQFFLGPAFWVKHQFWNQLIIVPQLMFHTSRTDVAMPMTRWEFGVVPCLAGENASATCLQMLVMRFADVQ